MSRRRRRTGAQDGAQSAAQDRALLRELAARLDQLNRDCGCTYRPALERLMRLGEPGADTVEDELSGVEEELKWLRHDLQGLTWAGGDRDLHAFWFYGQAAEAEGWSVFRTIAEHAADPAAAYERYRRGKAKAERPPAVY